jgi:hypothetical protein
MSGALAIDYTHTGDRPQVNTRRMWLGSGNVEEGPGKLELNKLIKLVEHLGFGSAEDRIVHFCPIGNS